MTPELRYFREEAVVRAATVSVSTTAALALQADRMRYAISIWNDGTIDLTVTLWESTQPATGMFHVPSGMGPVVLSEDVLGELIRLPMWVKSQTAGPTSVTFYTASYCEYRYQQMRSYVDAKRSEYGSL